MGEKDEGKKRKWEMVEVFETLPKKEEEEGRNKEQDGRKR